MTNNRVKSILGIDQPITRRDFLDGAMIGAGSALLWPGRALAEGSAEAKRSFTVTQDWYGPGGIGDYAASHGNTPKVVELAHRIHAGEFDESIPDASDTGEVFDVVVVGCGIAGLGAAYEFTKIRKDGQTCLMLDNHPVFGGEAKRNEIAVNGHLLVGPQGSNGFSVPDIAAAEEGFASGDAKYYREFGIPSEFDYAPLENASRKLKFCRDNYGFIYWREKHYDIGHFFDEQSHGVKAQWVSNAWSDSFARAPLESESRKRLGACYNGRLKPYDGDDFEAWLDRRSYKDVIEKDLGFGPEVTAYFDPILASAIGLGCDAISAYGAYAIAMPGVDGYYEGDVVGPRHSFPGGNDGFARHFVKAILPEAIEGKADFADILTGRIRFDALDRPGRPVRMRLASTVVRVEHEGRSDGDRVMVTYLKNGTTFRVRAKSVVMAAGGWVNKRVVRDLPETHREAYDSFIHAPFLVANVAITNWRFLDKLGITGCRYDGGFGFSCNIRQPMRVGDYQPALDPDKPALLTFYKPFYYPALEPRSQGQTGRYELLTTVYAAYEMQIREQMVRLFGSAGFDPRRDIAGLVLNRWGHAYVAPGPGFYFGVNGRPAARDVVRTKFGRIAFGHSELRGNQHWGSAAEEGARAVRLAVV